MEFGPQKGWGKGHIMSSNGILLAVLQNNYKLYKNKNNNKKGDGQYFCFMYKIKVF